VVRFEADGGPFGKLVFQAYTAEDQDALLFLQEGMCFTCDWCNGANVCIEEEMDEMVRLEREVEDLEREEELKQMVEEEEWCEEDKEEYREWRQQEDEWSKLKRTPSS
jgi:hypothetical protein